MTIASALSALSQDITNARTAITGKGGTVTVDGGSSQLATDIGTITELKGSTTTINPSTSSQTATPTSPSNGFTSVTVPAVTSSIDANIQAGNIKKDVSILGVTGTYEGGASTRYGADIYAWTPNNTNIYKTCNTNISFDGLVNLQGAYRFAYVLAYQKGNDRTVTFPDLIQITGSNALYEFSYSAGGITGYYFPKLQTTSTEDSVFYGAFRVALAGIYFPKLETADGSQVFAMSKPFHGALSEQTTVSFDKLSSIKGSQTFYQAFFGLAKQGFQLLFPSLRKTSFGSYTNQFSNMFQSSTVSGVQVHFVPSLANTIPAFDGVATGYGNANVTTLYDLGGTVNLSVTPNTTQAYVYGELVENNTCMLDGGEDGEIIMIDSASSTTARKVVEDVEIGETYSITEDLTSGYDTIKFESNQYAVSGKAILGGYSVPLIKSGNDFYFKDKSDVGTEINVCIYGDESHSDYSATIITTGSDITESASLGPATWSAFTRPNLTENGILGGTSFAVAASSVVSTASNRQAFRAVDGSTSTTYYWQPTTTDTNITYTFYNPKLLKVTDLEFRWTNTNYRATQFVLSGSKDGSTWTTIGTYALSATNPLSVSVDGTNAYNYFKIAMTKNGSYVPRLVELNITATEKN